MQYSLKTLRKLTETGICPCYSEHKKQRIKLIEENRAE
jgi:hypothetical protein